MKFQDLKPSVGLMRIWIVSIFICFILTMRDTFDGEMFFSSIFLTLFRFIAKLLVDVIRKGDGWEFFSINTMHLIHGLSATLVYVITSAIAYLMVMWIKEGFSNSKDGKNS